MPHSKRFFISCPHSGEKIGGDIHWLQNLSEETLMFDVDRFVDELYTPSVEFLKIPFITAQWHRYFSDPNRLPEDVDQGSVMESLNPPGTHLTGLLWQTTSQGYRLMPEPISKSHYESILKNYYFEFHDKVKAQYAHFFKDLDEDVFQLDVHSMPSQGTSIHRDPGETRSSVVISDQDQKSAHTDFVQLVIEAYKNAGFEVNYNWPYKGGRVTQIYGQPHRRQHCVQVELRRDLYMDEQTKRKIHSFKDVQDQLKKAVTYLYNHMDSIIRI